MTHASGARAKLTWLGVARSPYNDFLFAALARRYALTVVLQQKSIASHPWQLGDASYRVLHVREDRIDVLRAVREAEVTVMAGWNDPAYVALMPLLTRPRAFWTDTPDTRVRRGAGREAARAGLARFVFAHFDEVWSTGRPGREALEAIGCSSEKTRELPFFLDLDRLPAVTPERQDEASRFRAAHRGEGKTVFVGAGQLVQKKRYGDAIEALVEVPDAVLWLCGVGAEEGALRELASRRGVSERVVLHGWLQPDAMELAYLAADVFVHPAARDPFPTVVLDAMTWGKPVIGSNVSGSVVDRVTDGAEGFVIREGDVAAIASAMRHFVETPGEVLRMGALSRKTAERYPVTLAFDRVEQLRSRARR